MFAPGQVVAPLGIVGKSCRDGGQPAQHPDSGGVGSGGVDAVVQDGGGVGGVIDAALGQRVDQQLVGVCAAQRQDGEVAAQHRPGFARAQRWDHLIGDGVESVPGPDAQAVLGRRAQRVVVHVCCGRQSRGGVGGLAGCGGGRDLGAVAGQSAGQDVDGGVGVGGLGRQQPVGVALGGRQVEVVFVGGPGHRDVEGLAGQHVRADDVAAALGVAPACGQALGRVDGGRVAQRHVLGDVVGGQGDDAPAAQMAGFEAAIGHDFGDGVAVAVADEVVAPDRDPARVLSGADGVPGAGGQLVGQHHGGGARGGGVGGEAVGAGAGVERVDDVVGGGQQDGVCAGGQVGAPRVVGHVGGGVVGADMDAVVVDVEADAGRVGVVQRQPGGSFGGRPEAHYFGEGERVGGFGDVA